MKKVLIFDYDGVVINSLPIVLEILVKVGPKYGLNNVKTKKDLQDIFDNNFYDGIIQRGVKKRDITKIIDEFKQELKSKQKEIPLFEEIKEVLDELSKKYTLIVVTSNMRTIVEYFLKKYKISAFSETLGAEDHVSKVKKILYVKEKYDAEKYYYIGDTVGDILEGKKANVITVATSWGYHNKERLAKSTPDYIFDSPKELLKLI